MITPPQVQKTTYSAWFLIVIITLGLFFVYKTNPKIFTEVKNIFKNSNSQLVFKNIGKEISNSGKLIANGGESKIVLTSVGTFDFTNVERSKARLSLFSPNKKLDLIAKNRVDDMFAKQYFEHVSPSKEDASSEAKIVGYEYISIGENIALGNFEDDEALVIAWMNSPGHRANILNGKFTELGVAVGKGVYEGRKTWIAVQIFAKPISSCPSVDSNLKESLERKQIMVEVNEQNLIIRKAELENMRNNSKTDRSEYNEKVNEYNNLVAETNSLINEIKDEVLRYNASVKAFNRCIEN